MSRKRSHKQAFAMEVDLEEDRVYLSPGCYPQIEHIVCGGSFSDAEMLPMEEQLQPNQFNGIGLYVADAYGNIFYNCGVRYASCEEVVYYSDICMKYDDSMEPEAECSKRNREDEDEDMKSEDDKSLPEYNVEEPPSKEDRIDEKESPK